jgi:hypothetical protein
LQIKKQSAFRYGHLASHLIQVKFNDQNIPVNGLPAYKGALREGRCLDTETTLVDLVPQCGFSPVFVS